MAAAPSRWFRAALVASAAVVAGTAVVVGTGSGAEAAAPLTTAAHVSAPPTRAQAVAAAARYGSSRGFHIGVAVYDRRTRMLTTAGHATGAFASESVVKVFIATRLLVTGQMSGATEATAYKMITQSDDASADKLYGRVGGDGLINWVKSYFHLPDLGSAPTHSGWWGNTHITPVGLVRFYAKVAADRRVGPWLLNAMHHAHKYGSDGTYQFFGIPSATKSFAVKQGWGCEYTNRCAEADFNSTGFVDDNRYAVALLARGPLSSYGSRIANVLTGAARVLLPGGVIPPPPHVTVVSQRTVRVAVPRHAAATIYVVVHTSYGTSRAVAHRITLQTPPHDSGTVRIRVVTAYGSSPAADGQFRYVGAPTDPGPDR